MSRLCPNRLSCGTELLQSNERVRGRESPAATRSTTRETVHGIQPKRRSAHGADEAAQEARSQAGPESRPERGAPEGKPGAQGQGDGQKRSRRSKALCTPSPRRSRTPFIKSKTL